jgi:hypothetical protein
MSCRRVIVGIGLFLSAAAAQAQDPLNRCICTGLKLLSPSEYESIAFAQPVAATDMKKTEDLSPWFAKVDATGQGDRQNSCVGWAIAALKSFQETRESVRKGDVNTTPPRFSPAFVYNALNRDPGCQGLVSFVDALNLLGSQGIALWEDFPYDTGSCAGEPSDLVRQRARRYVTLTYRKLNAQDENELKRQIHYGWPVLVGMQMKSNFLEHRGSGVYQSPQKDEPDLAPHAMVIVGFDDNRQAFKVLNSWGSRWGDGGYAWIAYPTYRRHVREAYQVHDLIEDPAAVSAAKVFRIVTRGLEFDRVVSDELQTADHNCQPPLFGSCEGEPTRTRYSLAVDAGPGSVLRDPKLECVDGPCHGWYEVKGVELDADGHRAKATWDVWGSPTKWRLSARQDRIVELARIAQRIDPSNPFDISVKPEQLPPLLEFERADGTRQTIVAGSAASIEGLTLASQDVTSVARTYTYVTAPVVAR